MPRIEINHLEPGVEVANRLMDQVRELIERVRRRAYVLFEQRGGSHGADVEDWFRAEEEILFPARLEVRQEPGSYNLCMFLPGFAAQNLKLYSVPNGLIFECNEWEHNPGGDCLERGLFYWWPLPTGAQVDTTMAELNHNCVEIRIPLKAKIESTENAALEQERVKAQHSAAA